ncbi:BTAD domain-containing putative transcriptional regulator [Streptomyces hypolithicus]
MRYRILGRLDVHNGTQWSAPTAAKQRAVLGCLLINANHFVSAEALIWELWGDHVPDTAAKSLQVYVHRLRRSLGTGQGSLLTRPTGYELTVHPDELDVEHFSVLALAGRTALAEGRPDRAVEALTEAQALWRGRALADVPSTPSVQAETSRLEECRLAAWQDLADARLAAGMHRELAAELSSLLAEQPLRECLWARLVLALHGAGRHSDALHAYGSARRLLLDELGVEPGPELRDARRVVLGGAGHPDDRPPTRQLPAAVTDFVGRDDHLARVLDLLARPGDRAPRTVIVTGVAGVGKSSFAVHAAHRLGEAFPDGLLHVDLRTSAQRPAEPADALTSLLATLGVTGPAVPRGLEDRARRYRAELAGRRVLVVLDNATDERQLRPLLPGSGDSAVLITSRGGLAGLEGALRVDLDLLTDDQALTLLARASGERRTRDTPAAAGRIARLCGNLPLALRIAGARLATRPHLSAVRLADALADERRRLDELVAGDLEVRTSVSLSYEALDPRAQRAFELLGLLAPRSIPGWVLGALLDSGTGEAARVLDTLVDSRLLEVAALDDEGEPRFGMHDLVRLYASERAAAHTPPDVSAAALARVCEAYLALAQRADLALSSGFAGAVPTPEPRWRPPDAERLLARPQGWLDTERTTLCALVHQAEAGTAWRLAGALVGYFESGAHFDDWRETHERALAAAREAGDRLGQAVILRGLGELDTVQDRYTEAIESFQRSLHAYASGDRPEPGESAAAAGLGVLLRLRGRYGEAIACLERSIGSAQATGNARAQAYARCALGTVYLELGATAAAHHAFERSLELSRAADYPSGECAAQRCLGLADLAAARLAPARARLELARRLAAERGNRVAEVHALQWLGHLTDVSGDAEQAERMLLECLTAYGRFGEPFGEALTLRSLADLHLHAGREGVSDHEIPQVRRVPRHVIPHPRGHVIPHGDDGRSG